MSKRETCFRELLKGNHSRWTGIARCYSNDEDRKELVAKVCRRVERLDRQIQLGRSVLWWYIAPIILGVNVLYSGLAWIGVASITYCIATLLISWWIYQINQSAVSKTLVPLRDELAGLFDEMGESD